MITSTQGMTFIERQKANRMNMHELKAGDEVFLTRYGISYDHETPHHVQRVTPTQLVINGMKFYKDSGDQVGRCGYGTHISVNTFVEETKSRLEKVKRFNAALGQVKQVRWEFLPIEVLTQVLGIVEHARAERDGNNGNN